MPETTARPVAVPPHDEGGPRARLTAMRRDRLPLTYDECRARFRHACTELGLQARPEPITARGPHGQELTVDWVRLGPPRPRRVLVVMSGTHGVEGSLGSALQCDLLGRLPPADLPADTSVLLVHAVNPWGMAWWRRYNESNVDLNRNWARDTLEPPPNPGYDAVHQIICPDTDELPDPQVAMTALLEMVEAHGMAWVRDAITVGQYTRPDGFHYGGGRTEESTRILERVAAPVVGSAEWVFVVDLHTAHGPWATCTLLSDRSPGSPQDRFLREHFPGATVEATRDNPEATTGAKTGQLGAGITSLAPTGATTYCTTVEFGTVSDEEQMLAAFAENWVWRRGRRDDPAHAAAIWANRCAYTPDDPEWEARCLALGGELLDAALDRSRFVARAFPAG